jgi:cystathionine beta-lyase/cystathionine gamma-synthase
MKSTKPGNAMHRETKAQHPSRVEVPEDNAPMTFPIYQSVKFDMPTVEAIGELFRGERSGYFYSRKANPTVRQLEVLLAEQQGTEDAICFASGLGAIHCLYAALLNAGDRLLLFRESYMPSRLVAQRIFSRFGVQTDIINLDDHAGFERAMAQRPRMVLFESPTNPMLRIADIRRIATVAAANGTICVLDNTFAGLHQHHGLGVNLFVHSLTKYAAGHGDVLGGAICGSTDMIRQLRAVATEIGASLDPHAAFLILRGMKTYYLRREKQQANAQEIVRWLENCKDVEAMYYPGSATHPDIVLAKEQMSDFGSLISFDLVGGAERLTRFLNALQMVRIAASLGSTETIIAPVTMFFTVDLTEEQRKSARIAETSVRLSVGIENVGDILNDLSQAFAASR